MTNILPHFNTSYSQCDRSVNHVLLTDDGGMLECRFVQRTDDYFIIYVSSHTGCNLSCRFCHLTATKQTMMRHATLEEYVLQVKQVLTTYKKRLEEGGARAKKVHVNFMSRGEALCNETLLARPKELFEMMETTILELDANLDVHFLVSSIVPETFNKTLEDILVHPQSYLYYSLYSLDHNFRKRWVPKAKNPFVALDMCKDYQAITGQRVALHWAFIENQNDQVDQVQQIIDEVLNRDLKVKFNLVRYNPLDHRHGVESSEETLEKLFGMLKNAFGDNDSRIVPRVGFDVKASCGMFVERD